MKPVTVGIFAIWLLSWPHTCAVAQPPPIGGFGGPSGFGGGPTTSFSDKLMILSSTKVQDELELTDEQRKQIAERTRKRMESFQELRQANPEDIQAHFAKQLRRSDAMIAKLLDSKQSTRLAEICLQQSGPRAFDDPKVAKALGLTKSQKSDIKQITENAQREIQSLFESRGQPLRPPPGGFPSPRSAEDRPLRQPPDPKMMEEIHELRKQADEKILSVLTAAQQSTWKEMQGEPFELDRSELMSPRPRGQS